MVKTRKFKLNKDMVEGEILDCVYTSSWNENNPNANYVSYEVDDYFYESRYDADIVEGYFNEGSWIEII